MEKFFVSVMSVLKRMFRRSMSLFFNELCAVV